MIELPLIFLGGLLGSAHCVGMCGGFALLVGSGARSWSANLGRQLVYSAGRIFTYAVIGGALGYAGLRLAEDLPAVIQTQALLAIVAGALLIVQGLASAGVLRRGIVEIVAAAIPWNRQPDALAVVGGPHHVGCAASSMLASVLRAPGLRQVLVAGVLTGFLPCGLVYAFLALAASTSGLLPGLTTMAVFGLGTVPLMVVTGCGASLVSIAARQRLLRLAAWCVVLTGLVSTARGVAFLQMPDSQPAAASCPLCP